MTELYQKLGYEFRDRSLLLTALTHSSYANENKKQKTEFNERLEFLGDSVLGMVVARALFSRFPHFPEGKLTRLRAELVCEQSLYGVALQLDLGRYLRLGRGEEKNGGRQRPSILADAVEAVLAAVYLDGGLEKAAAVIHTYILDPFEEGRAPDIRDYKTELQELAQSRGAAAVTYRLTGQSGPDHQKVFTMEALVDQTVCGSGSGGSKKEAEMAAARDAMEHWSRSK